MNLKLLMMKLVKFGFCHFVLEAWCVIFVWLLGFGPYF